MTTIRELREELLISRERLAEMSGVSLSTLVRIENSQAKTTHEIIDKILRALSESAGREIPLSEIEGINFYHPMRDRRRRISKESLNPNDDGTIAVYPGCTSSKVA